MRLDAFWSSNEWRRYEVEYGDAPGTRTALLASALWTTRVLDLRPDEATLWRGVRRSYRGLVNRLTKDPQFENVIATPAMFLDPCRSLQDRVAPAWARPVASWQVQAEWIEQGVGVCLLAQRRSQLVAFAYAIRHQAWAYYGFGKSAEPNAHHALLWALIRRLKADGTTWLELGWQGQATDPKGQQIEFYKRGWGGTDMAFNTELFDA